MTNVVFSLQHEKGRNLWHGYLVQWRGKGHYTHYQATDKSRDKVERDCISASIRHSLEIIATEVDETP